MFRNIHHVRTTNFAVIILVTAYSLGVFAEEEVFEIEGAVKLDFRGYSSDITLKVGTNNLVVVNYEVEDEYIRVVINQYNDEISIEEEYLGNRNGSSSNRNEYFVIELPSNGRFEIDTISGSIDASGFSGDILFETVSGEILLEESTGDITLTSISGDIELVEIDDADLQVMAVSGDIIYKNGSLRGESYRFSNVSGNTRISHYDDASYRVRGGVVNGSIYNEVDGGIVVTQQEYGPNKEIEGSYNGGETSLRIKAVSGNITLSEIPTK